MKQWLLYIFFMLAMVFSGHGEVLATTVSYPFQQDSKEDRLVQVEHKRQKPDAQLEDASRLAYRVCSSRPQRLSPNGNIHGGSPSASRLLSNRIHFLSSPSSSPYCGNGLSRLESAPIHFDVASKYYIICLRHLLC